jgi:D-serine dehydratase
MQVPLEGGYPGGRAGCRDLDTALGLAHSIKSAEQYLALRGVEGFEGLFAGTTAQKQAEVARFSISWLRSQSALLARDCSRPERSF